MFLFLPIPAVTRTLLIALITGLVLVGIMLRPWKTQGSRPAPRHPLPLHFRSPSPRLVMEPRKAEICKLA